MSDFAELLQEAEKLTNELEGTAELPKVDRSLKQVLEASNDLYSKVAQTGAKDISANLLLGSKGIDLPKIAQKLESISSKRTFEPIQPVEHLDITNILNNEIRNSILASFESGYEEMMKTTYDTSWEHQESEWKQEKRKILSSMGATSDTYIDINRPMHITYERTLPVMANLSPTETIYVSKIIEYNNYVSRAPKPNLVNIFAGLSAEFKDTKVTNMWEIIKYMSELPPCPLLNNPMEARTSKKVAEALVRQGKKYLEDRYKTYMNNIINENLAQAVRGGVPGTYPLVLSFVGLRLQGEYTGLQDGYIDDRPLWPVVYYCLRSGDLSATSYCLRKSGLPEFQELINILDAKLNRPDSPEIYKLEDNLRYSYKRIIRNETDPFKRIVWSVLGCCDTVDEHSEVATTTDDWLWLKLNLVRVNGNKEDCIDYAHLQHVTLIEYGESHYDAVNQPYLYFQVLALTGQFEAAIEFLSRTERFRVHGVHMAIALNELFMLAGPTETNAPLLSIDPTDPKPARRLNLVRLVMLYIKKFELTSINEALHYFFLLRNYTDDVGQSIFKTCVSYLAVETKEYDLILGKVQRNGLRTKGLVDQFNTSNLPAESIAQLTAENLMKKGLDEEAIDLFDIANNQEEVLKLMCGFLSRTVHLDNDSLRDRIRERALIFQERYSRDGFKTSSSLVHSFTKLRELLIFFDYYHMKQYPQAIKTLTDLQLIPLKIEDVDERLKSLKGLNANVCKVIPDVLLATMNMLFAEYQKIKGNNEYIPRYQNESTEKRLAILREQAKCITYFTGMLPYRMPGDTNGRLVQMEILMH